MKKKIKTQRIGAAVMLVLGLAALIFGLAVRAGVDNRKDISQLKAKDLKSGTYVKGSFEGVSWGPLVEGEDNRTAPLMIYSEDSKTTSEDAVTAMFVTNAAPGTGKYICMLIDEFESTDIFLQISSGRFVDFRYMNDVYEFDGVITRSSKNDKRIKDFLESWKDTYKGAYYRTDAMEELSEDNLSLYYIEIKNISGRRYWWIYSLPLLMGGAFLLADSFIKNKKKKQ